MDRRRSHPGLLLFCVVCVLTSLGCGSGAIMRLPSEDSIPHLASSKALANRYHNNTELVSTRLPQDKESIDIAIHETGNDQATHTIVMVHGVFTDHSTWRFLRGNLVNDYRLWLIDLPGCGQSGTPELDDNLALYTPRAMGERMLQSLEARIAQLDTAPRLTLVGHSLAGQVILQAMSDPKLRLRYENTIDAVESIVLFSPLDLSYTKPNPVFVKITRLNAFKVSLAWNLGILERSIANATRDAYSDPSVAPREDALKRLEVLRDSSLRRVLQAMLRQAIPRAQDSFDTRTINELHANLASVETPVLIIWGKRDTVFPYEIGYRLADRLPNAELMLFQENKHSVHQSRPIVAASIIDAFVQTHLAPQPSFTSIELAVARRGDGQRRTLAPRVSQELLLGQ
ncbi:MAG: alpha/beta fold hydrolase [Phycisphaerales bacterium JB043]